MTYKKTIILPDELLGVILDAVTGEKQARDTLMSAFYAFTIKEARRHIVDHDDAANVALSVWEWLYKGGGLATYAPNRGTFTAWLRMVISNRAKDWGRRMRPRMRYTDQERDVSTDEFNPIDFLSGLNDLEAICAEFSPQQLEVFWMLMEGTPPTDIAKLCDISDGHARRLIAQIRSAIKKLEER